MTDATLFCYIVGAPPGPLSIIQQRHHGAPLVFVGAAKLANLSDGQRADKVEGVSIDTASNMLNVGRASVARAREVHANATPELQRAVEQGKMAVIHISCKLSIDTT